MLSGFDIDNLVFLLGHVFPRNLHEVVRGEMCFLYKLVDLHATDTDVYRLFQMFDMNVYILTDVVSNSSIKAVEKMNVRKGCFTCKKDVNNVRFTLELFY